MSTPPVQFLPLSPDHLGPLHGWLQQAHVRAFWDDGDRSTEQVWANYFTPDDTVRFVIVLDGRLAGYLQAYPVEPDSDYAGWRSPEGDTWGTDLLLGNPADIGRGLGPRVIGTFAVFWQARHPSLRRLLVDPNPQNTRAIRAYLRAGFRSVAGPPDPPDTQMLALDLGRPM